MPIAQFAVGVTAVHLVFALLEKKRLENWKEKGEAGHFGASPFDPVGERFSGSLSPGKGFVVSCCSWCVSALPLKLIQQLVRSGG